LDSNKIKSLVARYNTEYQYRQEPLIDASGPIDLHTTSPLSKLALHKTAGFPPPQFQKGGPPPGLGDGDFGSSGGKKRNIPKDHPFEPRALKPMAKGLWAASVSLGHALTALRYLSRIKSATVSPDGMLGGRGYVMQVPEMRKTLQSAIEGLSSITDTLHDEMAAPHWKPQLANLDQNEAEDIENFVQRSRDILDDPEQEADDEATKIEEENDDEEDNDEKAEAPVASDIPGGGSPETNEAPSPEIKDEVLKTASSGYTYIRTANSSIPVETLSGPRVEHLDREDADSINPPEAYPNDDWGQPGQKEYEFPSPWDNDLHQAGGGSGMPIDPTPTDGWDFGLGYGAEGDGAGGYENPTEDGKGVWGPHAGLPGTPAGSSGDTTPALDSETSRHQAQGLLPGDSDRPVARSDYYRGDKGNQINYAQSELPAEAPASVQVSPGLMNTDYVYEDVEPEYTTYDYTTHNYRRDQKVNENG
jgi:hypothetical protein